MKKVCIVIDTGNKKRFKLFVKFKFKLIKLLVIKHKLHTYKKTKKIWLKTLE